MWYWWWWILQGGWAAWKTGYDCSLWAFIGNKADAALWCQHSLICTRAASCALCLKIQLSPCWRVPFICEFILTNLHCGYSTWCEFMLLKINSCHLDCMPLHCWHFFFFFFLRKNPHTKQSVTDGLKVYVVCGWCVWIVFYRQSGNLGGTRQP